MPASAITVFWAAAQLDRLWREKADYFSAQV